MALVIGRRKGEEIIIGDEDVIFKVEKISGNFVAVSVQAPKSVAIHRREIFERIRKERAEAVDNAS